MKRLVMLVALVFVAAAAAQETPLAPAVELSSRAGLPNAIAKLRKGGPVTVAYIGGSITAQNGYRPKTTKWLAEKFPEAKITEINASIGGTGSDLGVFRFRRDVLDHKPDLVFIEFAVNDGGAPPKQIIRNMEGMVRQAWRQDPSIDICFVYTLVDGWEKQIADGKFPRSASAMEQVAAHYDIPTIHMGVEVARMAKAGTLVMKAAPKTDEENKALEGRTIFSPDGVHPHPETGHALYFAAVRRSFETLIESSKPMGRTLKTPLDEGNFERAKVFPFGQAKLGEGWQELRPDHAHAKRFGKYLPRIWAATTPDTGATVKFRGTYLAFMDLLGPDGGQLEYSLDGGPAQKQDRFDGFSTYPRIGSWVAGRDLPDGPHAVTVKLTGATIDKAAILSKRNEKVDDPKRFGPHHWHVAWIMVVGELE
jgi:lysophospholipase L1-like esterase